MATVSTENLLLTLQVDANQALASLKKVDVQTKQTQQAFSGVGKNTKQFNAAIQNSSYQIADFAVQVGGGVSALKAFSQQAPQLLSGFGAIGAAAGAAVAILAAGANSLFNFGDAAEDASKSVDKFKNQLSALGAGNRGPVSELTKALEGASGAMLGFILNLNKLEQRSVAKALDEAQQSLNDYIVELTRYTDAANTSVLGVSAGIKRLKGDTAALEGIAEKLKVDASVASDILALIRAFEAGTLNAEQFAEALSDLAVAGKVDDETLSKLTELVTRVRELESAATSLVPSLEKVVVTAKKFSKEDIDAATGGWTAYAEALKDSIDPSREYYRELEKIRGALERGKITADEAAKAVSNLQDEYLELVKGPKRDLKKPLEDVKTLTEEIRDATRDWSKALADDIVDGLAEGKLAFEDFANFVLQQLAKIALTKALDPLFDGFTNLIGGIGGASAPVPAGLIATPVNDLPLSREASSAQQMIVGVPRMSAPSPSSSPVTVNVMNYGSDDVEVNERKTSRGIEVDVLIKNTVKQGLASGDFDKVMATSYGARRLAF